MTEFEMLKAKAEEIKSQRDQALGAIKSIEDGWEKKYGTRDAKVLDEKLAGMEKELEEMKGDFNSKILEAKKILGV